MDVHYSFIISSFLENACFLESIANIIFAFPFGTVAKDKMHDSICVNFKKKTDIENLVMVDRRKKDIKFAITPSAVVLL